MNKNNYGWICPKCGRVYSPFTFGCDYCNNNGIKTDPCIITPPWSQDYSKYKSEVTTDTHRCNQDVTINDEYLKYTTSRDFNSEYITHTHSSQEQLQESLDGLNKELENLGAQPTNLDELNNIKNNLNQDSNDDLWPTEQEVKAHLKYIKEQTELEKNNPELKDVKTAMEDIHRSEEITQHESNDTNEESSISFLRRTFPRGGITPEIITKCKHCGDNAYLNKKCPICDKFNGDESLKLNTNYAIEHWICSRCGKVHLVFPEGGCECGAPLEYLTYVV